MRCKKCGAKVSRGKKYCGKCGQKVSGKRKKKVLFVILLVFLVLVGGTLGAAFILGSDDSAELTTVSETEYTMYLSADQTDFSVNETAIVTLTVHTPDADTVGIYDEDDNCLATLSSENEDEEGNWSVELDISSEEDCVLSLTARSDVGSSLPLTLYVTSPITGEMMQECADVLDELDEYLAEEGYEDNEEYDAEALELAANWLEADERVASVSRGESMTLFVTNDHVTGGCMLPSEESTFGTSDNDYESYQTKSLSANLYKIWSYGIDLFPENNYYVNGYNTATNNNVLILSPLYNSAYKESNGIRYSYITGSYDNYIEVLGKYGEDYLDDESLTKAKGEDAIHILISEDANTISNYGIIIFNTHGGYKENSSDGTKRMSTNIWTYDETEFESMLNDETIRVGAEEVNNEYFYGTTEYLSSRLVLLDDSIIATSNFYMSKWQSIEFDNAIIYLGICYGLCDDTFNDFLVSHGAVAVIGYTQSIDQGVEKMRFKALFSRLLSKGTGQAYKTIEEATTSNYGIGRGILTGLAKVQIPDWIPVIGELDGKWSNQKMYVYSARDDFTLYGYGTLSGTVELSEEAKVLEEDYSVAGATVTAYRYLNKNFVQKQTTTADQDGSFSFSNLEYGVYAIVVEKDDFRTSTTGIVYENQSQDGGTIYLTPDTNLVKGTVLDDISGDPVAGATVVCSGDDGSSQTATTDEDGVYKFKKLNTGDYTLSASAEGYYQSDNVEFTVESNSFLITPEDLYVKTAIEVSGYVVDSETEEKIEGATVRFQTSEETVEVTTDASGSFTVTVVPGSTRITVTKSGYDDITYIAVLSSDENDTLELEINPLGDEDIPIDAVSWNGHHYYYYDTSCSWEDAEAYCEAVGGHLVTITSAEEQEFVYNYALSANGEKRIFIGLSDADEEGNWSEWVNGETVSYTNWGTGEPDDNATSSDVQNYGTIYTQYEKDETYEIQPGQWDDVNISCPFICEWEW